MTAQPSPEGEALERRLLDLERENRLLQEEAGQARRLRQMWQSSLKQLRQTHKALAESQRALNRANQELQHQVSELGDVRERLEQLAQSHKQVIEHMREGVIITDAKGLITAVNPAFVRITGYSAEVALGQNPRILKSGRQPERFYRDMWEVLTSQGSWQGEIWNRRQDGTIYPQRLSISAVRDWTGRTVNYIAVFSDISERKRMERELAEAKERAEAASRAKSAFLATMSHEIRTPMNGILGMAELMWEQTLPEEARSYLHTIIRSGESLQAIINEVLEFSSVETARLELEIIPFDLSRMLTEAEGLVRGFVGKKSAVTFRLELDPGLPGLVQGDPVRLKQVITNLASNAIKFTNEGSVTLRVQLVERSRRQALLRLQMVDTGIGISPEQFARLFKSFSQADSATTRNQGGAGLGLAISQRLVNLMGGSIEVESAPGRGSTFTILLPLPLVEKAPPPPETALLPLDPMAIPRDMRVLVVEDDPVNRSVVHGMLSHFHITPQFAENGRIGLEKMRAEPYQLVLMDCQMPEMDGYTACRLFREWERQCGGTHTTPVVAITANAFAEDRERCLAVGMDDYLSKPLRMRDLSMVLSRWGRPPDGVTVETEPAKPVMEDRVVLDRRVIQELWDVLGTDLEEAVQTYLTVLPERLAEVADAAREGDMEKLSRAAHALKSPSGQLGAANLCSLAKKLEEAGRSGNLALVPDLLKGLTAMAERTRDSLEQEMRSFAG